MHDRYNRREYYDRLKRVLEEPPLHANSSVEPAANVKFKAQENAQLRLFEVDHDIELVVKQLQRHYVNEPATISSNTHHHRESDAACSGPKCNPMKSLSVATSM